MTRAVAYSFTRTHLLGLIALGASALLHLAVIWGLSLEGKPAPAKPSRGMHQGLQVRLMPASANTKELNHLSQEAQSLYTEALQQRSGALANLPQVPVGGFDNTLSQSQAIDNVPLNQYYSSKQIDRKALPIGNIDTAQLQGEIIDTFPLQFRIYIDEKGKVTSIEQLAVLEQDKALANKLERLLYALTFIPAKKNGIEVNSYQDIEFSFQPTINEAHAAVGNYSIGGGLSK